jgi:hypothetical protein
MVQHILACGGEAFGERLLSKNGCLRALEVVGEYALNNAVLAELTGHRFDGHRIAVWGGSGGSIAFNDLDERMTIAYVMNKHVEDQSGLGYRGIEIIKSTYDALQGRRSAAAAK